MKKNSTTYKSNLQRKPTQKTMRWMCVKGTKVGEVGMTKSEVKNALDEIRDMSDEEIADNGNYIRKVAEEAYALIKNLERR